MVGSVGLAASSIPPIPSSGPIEPLQHHRGKALFKRRIGSRYTTQSQCLMSYLWPMPPFIQLFV